MTRAHPSWKPLLEAAYQALSPQYRAFLEAQEGYFPTHFLAAFSSLSRQGTRAILFGQDPYPRYESAIGYAFIDGAVKGLFSPSGFSKPVNRATSLRNFLKMQLLSQGLLHPETLSQEAIAKVDKRGLIETMEELRANFERAGILLLNTALVFTCKEETSYHVKAFKPFMQVLLEGLSQENKELILFGNLAKDVEKLLPSYHAYTLVKTQHPYNIGFIHDAKVQAYFGPKCLLNKA
ncbi:MAG: uracil-DNA glycosylase [Campylobacterales bacterium]|nr:uracil-DNA glycosylase [Campylobacterales bacterium]